MQFPNKLFVVLLSLYSNPGSRDTGSNIETYEHRHSGDVHILNLAKMA